MIGDRWLTPGQIVQGRTLGAGLSARFDAIVVGSGAGGAVVAALLAAEGKRVLVLEEGPHLRPEEIAALRPTQVMRKMWREGGLLAALGVGKTPLMAVAVGRNVGGSSVSTGGVCFRVPGDIHQRWEDELKLPEFSEKSFAAAYEDVERRMQIQPIPEGLRSAATRKFVEGASALGIDMHPLRRNTPGCEGNARCNFGCPKQAKMSVDLSYLPAALASGATILSDAMVKRVLIENGRAVGVEGLLLGGNPVLRSTAKIPFQIKAPLVILACGTLHTPLVLAASGLRSPHLGRHITLHPSARISAFFDEPVHGWDGALQSVYSDHFGHEGITLVGIFTPINMVAAAFPGVGPSHRSYVRRSPHLGLFGALVHDEGGGTLRPPVLGREGLLTYEMAPRDLARLRRSMTILGEIAFAGGAREVILPVFGAPPMRDVRQLQRFESEPLDPRRIESVSFHPLGSARTGRDADRGVVAPSGEVFGARGLFVADGSVVPTSVGVNSQQPIMANATRVAWGLLERRG